MSPRLDLPIAVVVWLVGFAWVAIAGSWLPLAAMAALAAGRLVAGDAGTRELLVPRQRALALGVATAAAMIVGTYVMYAALARAFPALAPATRSLYAVLNAEGYRSGALAVLVLVMSACEEIVWRGRPLGPADATRSQGLAWPMVARVAGVAILYGSAHVASTSLLLVGLAAGCGFVWGLVRVGGRSLWPAIVTHAAWDLAILVAWPLV
jgi:membrane protease YdiL (CAAX protease family)